MLAVAVGCVAMVIALAWLSDESSQWARWSATVRAFHLTYLVALGAAVYAAATLLGGLRLRHLEKGAS